MGEGTQVSSDPQGLLCATEKLDQLRVCMSVQIRKGVYYYCIVGCEVTLEGDGQPSVGCEFRGIWKVTLCISLERIYRAEQSRGRREQVYLNSLQCYKLLVYF